MGRRCVICGRWFNSGANAFAKCKECRHIIVEKVETKRPATIHTITRNTTIITKEPVPVITTTPVISIATAPPPVYLQPPSIMTTTVQSQPVSPVMSITQTRSIMPPQPQIMAQQMVTQQVPMQQGVLSMHSDPQLRMPGGFQSMPSPYNSSMQLNTNFPNQPMQGQQMLNTYQGMPMGYAQQGYNQFNSNGSGFPPPISQQGMYNMNSDQFNQNQGQYAPNMGQFNTNQPQLFPNQAQYIPNQGGYP